MDQLGKQHATVHVQMWTVKRVSRRHADGDGVISHLLRHIFL